MKKTDQMYSWNGSTVSWREYVDLRFDENARALDKAEASMAARLESMNEFREALKDAQAKFVTRDELGTWRDPIEGRIKSLELSRAEISGKASQTGLLVSYLIASIGIILSILSMYTT